MIAVKELNYGNFGKCVSISNGNIEVFVTLDFGPRIIRAGFVGGDNFMKEDTEFSMHTDLAGSKFSDDTFYNRGGHRFWISPEAMPRTYYPDNEPVSYEKCGDKIVFTPPIQVANEFALSIEIKMQEDENKLSINHIATNTGYWAKEFAPWSITVVAENGIEIIPQNVTDTGLLSNRILVFWPYTKIKDSRLDMTDKYIRLSQYTSATCPLKIGLSQENPWGAYFHHNCMFVKKYFPVKDGVYPDNGCTYETYTNSSILEMETLGELSVVKPGESVSHTEVWEFYKDVAVPHDDSEMDKIAVKYKLNQKEILK